jgi:hypothetical protein
MTKVRPIARTVVIRYWLCLAASYVLALAHHDQFGLAFAPFILLSLPWSAVAKALTSGLAPGGPQIVAAAVIALLGSGINAALLYLMIVRVGRFFPLERYGGRRSVPSRANAIWVLWS